MIASTIVPHRKSSSWQLCVSPYPIALRAINSRVTYSIKNSLLGGNIEIDGLAVVIE